MSYLAFHFVFIIPPILLMAATLPRPLAGVGGRRGLLAIPILCLIAFTYTTPWDNYLVAREVWWYGPDRVWATVAHVPVEEYLFFILQPILTGLFLYQYLGRVSLPDVSKDATARAAWGGAAFFGVLTVLGFVLLAREAESGVYLGLILGWAPPVLAGMWLYDGILLWRLRRVLLVAVGLPTVYLWVADAFAIHNGIWTISSTFTLGLNPFGLPVEEATFFLMTNLLVVKGVLLFLYGDHGALDAHLPEAHNKPAAA
jgi:lycopene cyclase domain-containing protein